MSRDNKAEAISFIWNTYNQQRRPIVEEWKEQRNFVFATDTTKTSTASLPWRNSTTLPKLTQIRDNLHSNYQAGMFPNDDWLRWEAANKDAAQKEKAQTIEAYMKNKTRISEFRTTISQLLYDYIDYGNAFATPAFEARFKMLGEEEVPDYIGPKAVRISPLDIVFDPTAANFRDTFKIIRSIKKFGELRLMAEEEPDSQYLNDALDRSQALRTHVRNYGIEDNDKAEGYQIDGFGSLQEYYQSDYVEVLEFWGDWHDSGTGELKTNQVITVIDRSIVLREDDIPSWLGHVPIYQAGWRKRPDNLWSMGPLANLVGMQYRLDHLENSKADAYDLAIMPPLAIVGEVEDFDWGPGCEVHLDDGGSVTEIQRNVQWVIQADAGIDRLEAKMEEFAGAPREAMGIRTPGEKTAFEVRELQNAAGRIFTEKLTTFETELLEPLLNAMLETARRNLETNDVIAVMDSDLGAQKFTSITKNDITANGILRPIGARHFAAQAQLLQNLTGILNGPLGELIRPHTSGKETTKLVEDALNLERYTLFSPNVAVMEAQETERLAAQAQETLVAEDAVEPEVVTA
jgi:hypothetical protein